MITVERELLASCYILKFSPMEDRRGVFAKVFNSSMFDELGVNFEINEQYYSSSRKNVVRGMHFQMPPYEHDKLVTCISGTVIDVLLDLRKGSNYGSVASTILNGGDGRNVFIPRGVAHGFISKTEGAIMLYSASSVYVPMADSGILWDSFGFDWGGVDPIISERDQLHICFQEFCSPF